MKGKCEFANCKSNAVNGPWCIGHGKLMGWKAPVKENKPLPRSTTPIRKESKKTAKDNRVNRKDVKAAIADGQGCVVNSPVCIHIMEGYHHIQKRSPKNKNLKKNKVPCCNPCNGFIEQNVTWAKAHGWWISKHEPIPFEWLTTAAINTIVAAEQVGDYIEFEEVTNFVNPMIDEA